MINKTVLSRSLHLMFAGVVPAGLLLLTQPVLAQQTTDASGNADSSPVQRVEITGSSIKRIVHEGALPVQVLTQEDIKKSGATTATDLIQNLPAMQGFTPVANSVNGGGAGQTTAALHAIPAKYTLVLLDGVRMATQGGAVNLESIPLDAIERVEILTDGASALYGSDAIAGVVNFILKKNKTDGDAYVTLNNPQHSGGRSWSAGVSKGFGDLEKDNFNVLVSYSHDDQKSIEASQRSFSARGGDLIFSQSGTNYIFDSRSYNHPTANLLINASDPADTNGTNPFGISTNPYFTQNGNCGPSRNSSVFPIASGPSTAANPLPSGSAGPMSTLCLFNYAATVQDIPSSTRDSGLMKATFKISDNTTAWATLLLTDYSMTAQYAPAAQPFGLYEGQNLYTQYVQPVLTANNAVITAANGGNATAYYRTVANGGRTDDYRTNARHFSTGFNSAVSGWDLSGVLTISNSVATDTAAGGYSDFNQFYAVIASGAYDPFMNTGISALNATQITGTQLSKSTSDSDNVKFNAQHDLFEMAGGTSIISVGGEFTHIFQATSYAPILLGSSGYASQPAGAAGTDAVIGGSAGSVPFSASRNNEGLSAEWLLPLTKTLEGNIATRYDTYAKTYSGYVYAPLVSGGGGGQQLPNADLGNSFSKATYKMSLRWTPTETLMLRGSYGTGFKAPSMNDIASTLTYYGSTSGSYACPFPGSQGCAPGSTQYDVLAGGNANSGSTGLKAENSKQWTLGARVEPGLGLSLGMDLWNVQITNEVLSAGVPEAVGFLNATQYANLFLNPYNDPVGQYTTIGFEETPLNGGVANYQGIDWDFSEKTGTPFGKLNAAWAGTYMLKQNYTFQQNGPVLSDLGTYGPDQSVTFRVQMHGMASLSTGPFTNTLIANYKSGYWDQSYTASEATVYTLVNGTEGVPVPMQLHVGSYTTFDWQGAYDASKKLNLTVGVKNLFDKNPPLSLVSAGGGNQLGYDSRYTDSFGRTFYLTAHYHF